MGHRMIYAQTISHLSKPIKYQLRVVLFALHRDTPFLSHRLRYKISTRGCFKFHFIAQKTVAREILAAVRLNLCSMPLLGSFISISRCSCSAASQNFKISPNFRNLRGLKSPLKFLRSHLAYARPDFAQTPFSHPHCGILR